MAQPSFEKTGISRSMDGLGRIVIPMELRRKMGIQDGDAFEILIDPVGHRILLQDKDVVCDTCGRPGDLKSIPVLNRTLCPDCRTKVREQLEAAEGEG